MPWSIRCFTSCWELGSWVGGSHRGPACPSFWCPLRLSWLGTHWPGHEEPTAWPSQLVCVCPHLQLKKIRSLLTWNRYSQNSTQCLSLKIWEWTIFDLCYHVILMFSDVCLLWKFVKIYLVLIIQWWWHPQKTLPLYLGAGPSSSDPKSSTFLFLVFCHKNDSC